MALNYDTPNSGFVADAAPSGDHPVNLHLSRSISGGNLSLFLTMSFGVDGDEQTDASYLGWMEVVRDALVGDGWAVTSFGQEGEGHRDILHT